MMEAEALRAVHGSDTEISAADGGRTDPASTRNLTLVAVWSLRREGQKHRFLSHDSGCDVPLRISSTRS